MPWLVFPFITTVIGSLKPHMAYDPFFLGRGCGAEPLPIHEAFACVWVDGEISNLKRGEVLEEVAALRGRDAKVAETGCYDHARSRDFVPLDWNAEPWFSRAPAAHANEQIRPSFVAELGIEMR